MEQLTEEQILEFWKKNKIYEKSKEKNSKGKPFYFMDGPPYATGHIHMGTALNKILKDVAMRSQRLQGKNVFDRAGYDTHGVPIEFQIEKEIGSKSKQDIEKFGVKKFITKCKQYATQFIDVMNKEFENLGVWMDFKNPYLTLDNKYVETIWDTFKVADKKDLLYLGQYPVHVCPRCETAVSYNEIEYEKQDDTSIYVKFPLKNKKNTFLIIWTTTPWTLPANTGVMVNPDFTYQEIELSSGENWIIAKDLVPKLMETLETGYTSKKEYLGKNLKDWEYENPLSKNLNLKTKNAYKVVLSSRYVNLEEGTGLVHCAPGHGKEDFEVGQKAGLDIISPVDISGNLTKEAGKYAGGKARTVDQEIIKDLEESNHLIYKHKYCHDYPHCWRCKTPLLMLAQPQWFLKISKIHSKILKENEKTNWIPKYMKLRMKAWLEGISDWPVSRKRYWGTPLPIWICEKCNEKLVIGNAKELEKLSGEKVKEVHKPEIDKIEIPCKKCKGKMKRVEDVLDVWFDSGVSSWAALNKEEFKKFWPADLNLEGKDQFRGWWNSQMILSQIKFDKKPFKNIIVHGMVLDIGKVKMSKSLGNIISPQEVIKKYNRDYLRYYFTKTSKGEDFAFDEKEFSEIQKAFRVLININSFIDQLNPKTKQTELIEDKWIISRFNSLCKEITDCYNKFTFPEVVQKLENFIVNDLSKKYIKIIRDRADETHKTLNQIRIGLLTLLAPIIPFTTEAIWQSLRGKLKSSNSLLTDKKKSQEQIASKETVGFLGEESIHLSSWPKINPKLINKNLEAQFSQALEIIEIGLAERDKAQIGLKWPLSKATITTENKIEKELQEIIARQLNVKKVEISQGKELLVKLDTTLTPELEAEGYARELTRKIQAERKNAGLIKSDEVKVEIISEISDIFEKQKSFIQEKVGAKSITFTPKESPTKHSYSKEAQIKDKSLKINFSKI